MCIYVNITLSDRQRTASGSRGSRGTRARRPVAAALNNEVEIVGRGSMAGRTARATVGRSGRVTSTRVQVGRLFCL